MGNQHSAPVSDNPNVPISQHDYYVLGDLRAGTIRADVVNCERIYVNRLKADKVQLCGQARVGPPSYQAFPPQREVRVKSTLSVRGTVFAGSVKCEKLNAYDVFYVDDLDVGKTEVKDRDSVNEHLLLEGGVGGAVPSGAQYYLNGAGNGHSNGNGPYTSHGGLQGGPLMSGRLSGMEPPPQYQHQEAPPPRPQQNFLGNFSGSAHSISLDHKFYLQAQCMDTSGRPRFSALDLNDYITNDNGQLRWVEHGNGNFGGSCRNVRLSDGGKVLAAEAQAADSSWRESTLWLDERVENRDGELRFVS